MSSNGQKRKATVVNAVLLNGDVLTDGQKKADIDEIEFQSEKRPSVTYTLSVGEYLITRAGVKHGIISSILYCDTPENVTDWDYAVFVYDLSTHTHERVPLLDMVEMFDEKELTTFD